jgi:hypothetical protein
MSSEIPTSSLTPDVEVPKPANVPRDLHEPYEWSNGWFPRSGMLRLGDVNRDGSGKSSPRYETEKNVEMAANYRELPHPNIAARMKTLGGRSIADVMDDAKYYPFDDVEYTEEQKAEELELIAGRPAEAEGMPKLGGAIKEIDTIHDKIKNAPTPSWIKRFKAFMFESQQFQPEFRMTKLQRDRRYLVQRAMKLIDLNPRAYKDLDDDVLAMLITAHQHGLDVSE